MHDRVRHTYQPSEAVSIIEVGQQGHSTELPEFGTCVAAAGHGENPEARGEPGNRAPGHVTATDDQYSLHELIISRPMSFQISLTPGGQSFACDKDQTILEAALAAGLVLPYGCRDGACGACKGKVITGEASLGVVSESALSPTERANGVTLFCSARPRSDLVLEVRNVTRIGDNPIKKLPCRIQQLERVADDVMIITAKLPATEPFRFRAGQYVDFLLSDGRRRSFSIANAPGDTTHLEFHVRRVVGGEFTNRVFDSFKERDILRFEGPLGTFSLQEDWTGPVVLIAGGTGFAPIKSIVEHAIATGRTQPMTMYWGARNRAGLYLDDLARAWEEQLPGFRYIPVLSEPEPQEAWSGRTGLVHHAAMADLPDLSAHQVYACGAPAMIEAARRDLVAACALPELAFFSDAFTFASDTAR